MYFTVLINLLTRTFTKNPKQPNAANHPPHTTKQAFNLTDENRAMRGRVQDVREARRGLRVILHFDLRSL
jgi:hypothetical protein